VEAFLLKKNIIRKLWSETPMNDQTLKSVKVFKTTVEIREWRKSLPQSNTVGFVPTMGALHAGHASLLAAARKMNDQVVLSIFVNPTQFNHPNDLKNYPKTWDTDLATATTQGVDVIFAPESMSEMYPDDYAYQLTEKVFSKELCGAERPGHFDGVLTVVMKLFQLVKPTKAYFGEKDHQQLTLIKNMIAAFFLDIELVPGATVREADGLAMSSRNVRLTPDQREMAPLLHRVILREKNLDVAKKELSDAGFRVEYLVDKEIGEDSKRRYIAAWLGDVRLIDNV
jgi:pantoate--beta-alanine ligase